MGGIGSAAPTAGRASSGELLSAIGSAASSAGWLIGSAAAAAANAASSAKDSAKEKLASARESYRQQGAFDTSSLSHLSRSGGSSQGLEGSSDISDLLGGCTLGGGASSAMPPTQPSKPAAPAAAAHVDDWGGDDSWDAAPTAAAPTVPADALPPLPKAAPTHYSGGIGGGVVARRKVAAVKASSDGWDDWGNDNW